MQIYLNVFLYAFHILDHCNYDKTTDIPFVCWNKMVKQTNLKEIEKTNTTL